MVVLITNLTDGPNRKPREVRVYNKRLRPGAELRVDAKYVDAKVRKLEDAGYISIGPVPAWYADYSAKRQTKNLSSEQVRKKLEAQRERAAKKEAANKEVVKASKKPVAAVPTATPVAADLSDAVEAPADSVSTEKKGSKKNKNRR